MANVTAYAARLSTALAHQQNGTCQVSAALVDDLIQYFTTIVPRCRDDGSLEEFGFTDREREFYSLLLGAVASGRLVTTEEVCEKMDISSANAWLLKHRVCLKLAKYNAKQRALGDERAVPFVYLEHYDGDVGESGYALAFSEQYKIFQKGDAQWIQAN